MKTGTGLAVLGIVLGLVAALWLTDAARAQQTLRDGGDARLLHPADIINREGSASLCGGCNQAIYTVPVGKWFVLTDLEANWPFGPNFSLAEKLGATVTVKREMFLTQPFHSRTGIAFRPGSQILVSEVSFNPGSMNYNFSGYLTVP